MLKSAAKTLAGAAPEKVDLRLPDFGVPSHWDSIAKEKVAAAAALVGWSDPRVVELRARYEAGQNAFDERIASSVRAALAEAPAADSLPILSGSATLSSSGVDCTPRFVRRLARSMRISEPARCALRATIRNEGPATMSLKTLVSGIDAFDSSGRRFELAWQVLSSKRRVQYLLAPGESFQLAALLLPRGTAGEPVRPLLLRQPSRGPLIVPGDERWIPYEKGGAEFRLGAVGDCKR